jgi:hypothetical protein
MALLKFKINSISVREFNNILILFLLSTVGVLTIQPLSIITFIIFLLLTFFAGRLFFKGSEDTKIITMFCFYTTLTILIYWFQYYQFPQNGGATGEGIYGGTDDLFFFQEATRHGISYRGDRSMGMQHYSIFLEFFNNIVKLYKIPKLIDLLFVNVFAFTFIPLFTKKVAEFLKFQETSIRLAFYFSAICPIMIINGLVLVRDGWTAMLLIASIYFVLERRFILLVLSLFLSFYFRISSGALTLAFVTVILLFSVKDDIPTYKPHKKIFYIIWIIAGILVSIPSIIFFLKINKINNTIFREGILGFIASSSDSKSAANFIYHLPAPLRIFIAPIFYFGSPFLSLKGFIYNNAIIIRSVIAQIFPLLFIVYFTLFVQFIGLLIKMNKRKIISLLFFTFIAAIVILSLLSTQPRHKTMLMPVFYLLVAYGFQNKNKNSMYFAGGVTFFLILFEITYNFI